MAGNYQIAGFTVTDQIIGESSVTTTCLAYDVEGEKCLATVVDRTKFISRAHLFNVLGKKKEWDETHSDAVQKYFEFEKIWAEANRRVVNLRHKNVCEVFKVIYDSERKQHFVFSEFMEGNPIDKATWKRDFKEMLFDLTPIYWTFF